MKFKILILGILIVSILVSFLSGIWIFYRGTTTTINIGGTHIIACDCTDTEAQDCTCAIWVPWPL